MESGWKQYFRTPLGYHFNISPSGVWVVGVMDRSPVGIDVEQIQSNLDIAEQFFAGQEREWLFGGPSSEWLERFCDLWTLKESYVKAGGKGLSIPLDSFCFQFHQGPFP